MKSILYLLSTRPFLFVFMIIANSVYSQPCNTNINNLHVRNTNTLSLYKTWNIYLYKPTFYKVPSLYTLQGTDTINIGNACAAWATADTTIAGIKNGVLSAKSSGNTSLTASINGQTVTIPLQVYPEVRPVEYEMNIDPYLSTPATNAITQVPVVVICFIPTNDGIHINTEEAGVANIPSQTIDELKKHMLKIHKHTKFSLEEGSKFRGYKNASAIPYVGYKIIDYIYVYEPVPRGYKDPGSSGFFGDYNVIVERFNGRKYVDTLGVKEFWMMGYHKDEIVPVESNMASPTTPDISNSYRFADDLPIYSNTYIFYNYNFTREGNEATHNHGHQIESMADYVNILQDGNTNLFSRQFRGYSGGSGPIGRAGDTHHPPNTTIDYDYFNYTSVESDILDWKPEGGTKTLVNANTWGSIPYNWPQGSTPNIESNWYIMWMQSIPGFNNGIPYGTTKEMTNWWEFLSNWESATARIGLYKNAGVILPVSFSSLKAFEKSTGVQIEWKVETETNPDRYEVEKSVNGQHFSKLATITPANGHSITLYQWFDANANNGNNYYRIKSVGKTGEVSYSQIVRVDMSKRGNEIVVYPNPLKGNTLNLYLHAGKGQYSVNLLSMTGQSVFKQIIQHPGGSSTQTLQLPYNLLNSVYQSTLR